MAPTRHNQPWSEQEEQQLREEFNNCGSRIAYTKIANSHSRTIASIKSRLVKLGLVDGFAHTSANGKWRLSVCRKELE